MILIGPTPPPIHGSAFGTKHLIEAVEAAGALAAHLETGEDDRHFVTIGQLDFVNVYFGFKHSAKLAWILARHREADLYVPISQNRWGLARDSVFIWLGALARRTVIVHLYGGLLGDFYESRKGLERWFLRTTFKQVDEAWVESRSKLGIFAGLIPDDRVRVLENTSDDLGSPELSGGAKGVPGTALETRRLRLLFLSNLIPEKGHGDLLSALELLGDQNGAGFELRLVGGVEPDEREVVEARAEALAEKGTTVEYVGPVLGAAKVAQFAWADAFVLPSRYPPEGQPFSVIEAMSASLPVVASDHSSIPYTVLDGEQGLIFPKGDIPALARALVRIRDDPGLRERLGRGARRRFEAVYAKPVYAQRVAALLAGDGSENE